MSRRVKPPRAELLMHLACADYNRSHAAALAGVSRKTFHAYLRHNRIKTPVMRGKLHADDNRLITALLSEAVPARTIARKFEVSHTAILRRKNLAGYRRR